MEIKLFPKWRPSTILNLRKLPFWSRDQYLHVILHLLSEFLIDRPIRRRDIAKKQYSIWRPSAFLNLKNFDFFVQNPSSEWKYASAVQIWLKSDNFRLRYGDDAIFKTAAVRHHEFAKIAVLVTWHKIGRWSFISVPKSTLSVWPHLFCGAGRENGRGEQLKWSLAFTLFFMCTATRTSSYVRPPSGICYDVIILHVITAF